MGVFTPVYPSQDLDKLDKQKRRELGEAILDVLHNDEQIRGLLKEKTWAKYQELVNRGK